MLEFILGVVVGAAGLFVVAVVLDVLETRELDRNKTTQ